MRAVFLANVRMKNNEGIYKKIIAEADALGNVVGQCDLVITDYYTQKSKIINTLDHTEHIEEGNVIATATQIIENTPCEYLYIRLMIPTFALVELMKKAKKRGIKVYYEIPTYPYYAEQFRSSKKKYRAIAKIAIDFMFSPFIYKYCDHIVVIRSKSNLPMKSKMVEITNGVRTSCIKEKSYTPKLDNVFRMVTVGTLYPYHGYDRILEGLKMCDEQVNDTPIEFHVVGESDTINDLKKMSKKLGLRRVFFHGIKTTEELNEMFEEYNVGLGCLALHRRNADTDTTLKIIEYYCRGVPVVTSGKSPYADELVTIFVPDDETPIDIYSIYMKWKNMPTDKLKKLSISAKKQFDWNSIFKDLLLQTGLKIEE